MAGDGPCGVPLRVLLFDLEQVDGLFQYAALTEAMLQNSKVVERRDTSTSGRIIRGLNMVNPVAWGWNSWHHGWDWDFGPIYADVQTNMPAVARNAAFRLRHYRRQFVDQASRGPREATDYVDMARGDALLARRLLRDLYKVADGINDETIRNARVAVRRADLVRTSASAALTVGLAFVPGGVLALSAAGIGYSLACELVMQAQDVDNAEIVAFIQQRPVEPENPAAKQAIGAVQTAAVNQAQNILNDQLVVSAERAAIEAEIKYAHLVEKYAIDNAGRNLKVRPLPRPVPVAGGGELAAIKASRTHARALAGAADDVASAEAKALSRSKIVGKGAGAAAAAVGLWFMRDDLVRAFASLKAEFTD